jgi:type II secretory pathway component PulF
MHYVYQAKRRDGTAAAGTLEADSLGSARQRLRHDGLFVVDLHPSIGLTRNAPSRPRRGARVNRTDLLMMLSQLTIMVRSGVDLAEALQNVTEHVRKPAFRQVLQTVHEDISAGRSFSDALAKHPTVFDETFVAGVAAGEHSGTINQVLERLTDLIRADQKLRNTVSAMLAYPLVLCGVTFLVLNALIFFVLPQFAKVFDDLGKPAPPLTRMMLDFGGWVSSHKLLVLLSMAAIVGGAACFRRTRLARQLGDSLSLNLVGVGQATRALITGRLFRLLGTMLSSGVPLIESIRLCRRTSRNHRFRELFEQVEDDVLHGEGLGKPLLQATFLPQGAAQMVATAERSGNLGSVLQTVGEYFESEGERRLRDLVKLLEPAVIVFLGVVVAAVVLSVVLPLLDVSTISR